MHERQKPLIVARLFPDHRPSLADDRPLECQLKITLPYSPNLGIDKPFSVQMIFLAAQIKITSQMLKQLIAFRLFVELGCDIEHHWNRKKVFMVPPA